MGCISRTQKHCLQYREVFPNLGEKGLWKSNPCYLNIIHFRSQKNSLWFVSQMNSYWACRENFGKFHGAVIDWPSCKIGHFWKLSQNVFISSCVDRFHKLCKESFCSCPAAPFKKHISEAAGLTRFMNITGKVVAYRRSKTSFRSKRKRRITWATVSDSFNK